MASITDGLNEKFGVAGSNIADAISQITGVYANDISEAIDAMTPGSGGGSDSGTKPVYTDEAIMLDAEPSWFIEPDDWNYSTAEEYYESEDFESAYANLISGAIEIPDYAEYCRGFNNLGFETESLKKLMANSVFYQHDSHGVANDNNYKCFGVVRSDYVCKIGVQQALDKFIAFDLDGTGPAVWVLLTCSFSDTFTDVTDPETECEKIYSSVAPYGGWYKYLGYGSSLNKKTVLTTDNVIHLEDEYDDGPYLILLPVRLDYEDGDYSVEDNAYQIAFSEHHEPVIFSFGLLRFDR